MAEVTILSICKSCKRPVDPKKARKHLDEHPINDFFDAIPIVVERKKKKGK